MWLALLLLLAWPAQAATLFGVVSNRSAAELAAGAERLAQAHPGHRLILRTTDQLAELSDAQAAALYAEADAVLLLGVFGEHVPRVERLLEAHPPRPDATLLALSGDPRLTPLARLDGRAVFAGLDDAALQDLTLALSAEEDPEAARAALARRYPTQAPWLEARAYTEARGAENAAGLMIWALARHVAGLTPPPPRPLEPVRFLVDGAVRDADALGLAPGQGVVAVLDYDSGDRAGDRDVHAALCEAMRARDLACIGVLARWGEASVTALEALPAAVAPGELAGIVVLQDFVIGGGEGREAATALLAGLDVPVFRAVRMSARSRAQWALSTDGVPWDKVHNRVAMPELQGQGQPHVVAAVGAPRVDPRTGLRLVGVEPLTDEIGRLADRVARWRALQTRARAEKRVAVVFYNHPPGRNNIGADNLDVPQTLLALLRLLSEAGYDTGPLPADSEALLEQLQERAVNLPDNAEALAAQQAGGVTISGADYTRWFRTLPAEVQQEVVGGPLRRLQSLVQRALAVGELDLARDRVDATLGDVRHLLEGVEHPSRERALDLLAQLDDAYASGLTGDSAAWTQVDALTAALQRTGIEGLSGWGEPPGPVMTWAGDVLVPGLTFGNVFLGPQPPRGWEVNEELLHANLSFPPHHQYLAWYHYIRDIWGADVVIHVGRHSTAEFLPGKRVGLSGADYPQIVLGDLPNAYIYIVDGVGEGIQAKRRGQGVILDHLTPALSTTPLYDQLLELRQLVESYEAAEQGRDDAGQARAVARIRELVAELDLEAELAASMAGELELRGISFAEVDDELLVHEVGHYLTRLQEEFMPLGLHVYGRPWRDEQVETMLASMFGDQPVPPAARAALLDSPRAEREALLAALDGRFIQPGKGNDPIRTPEVLPTGRNFHALGGEQLPTRLAWDLGQRLAAEALAEPGAAEDAEAVVLWASDTVRDEGAMIAFGLALLGVEPTWNSRGVVRGIQRLPGARRRDVSFVTSGLFRDLYPEQLVWLDRAWLLALDASSETIRAEHPALREALDEALARLGDELRAPGQEPLSDNELAAHWVRDALALLDEGQADAGLRASLRVFGNAPGGYGAGINRLAERSGAWDTRMELADAWINRMGHAYGAGIDGLPAHGAFQQRLTHTGRSYLGRASNLYGLLDNNDAFDYLGGLSLAVEQARGAPPRSRVISHADPDAPTMAPLETELLSELRGRELNPAWIAALMDHGYAGARTMGNEFVENLWGWQVTNPDIVQPWVWDEVKRVYVDDGHDLGLDVFLEDGQNAHVKANMLAILLVAVDKGFWTPSEEEQRQLAEAFARLVIANGLPGSGHTRPDHPVMDLVKQHLDPARARALEDVLARARVARSPEAYDPSIVSELEVTEEEPEPWRWGLGLAALALLGLGVARGGGWV
ncbi:MAG: cobaltochelatase subunit CobN [Alphaproteobacteria bacterium]|nr:cobaltochelatase subunit CobN [Alphaproteobacteria bacterium]